MINNWPWKLRHSFGDFYVLVDSRDGYLSDACVEGHAGEWREMANALREQTAYSAKRCAVRFADGSALFWSPRNSMGRAAGLPQPLASQLADIIDAELAKPVSEDGTYADD